MLNQERVGEMTRLAIFDQQKGTKYKPMAQYFRKDYIAKELIKSILTGTAAFCLIVFLWGVYGAQDLIEQINTIDLKQLAVRAAMIYAGFMACYLGITYAVYYGRYTRGRHEIRRYYMHLKKVNQLYRRDEQQ